MPCVCECQCWWCVSLCSSVLRFESVNVGYRSGRESLWDWRQHQMSNLHFSRAWMSCWTTGLPWQVHWAREIERERLSSHLIRLDGDFRIDEAYIQYCRCVLCLFIFLSNPILVYCLLDYCQCIAKLRK